MRNQSQHKNPLRVCQVQRLLHEPVIGIVFVMRTIFCHSAALKQSSPTGRSLRVWLMRVEMTDLREASND
jgi:hypothetical protein